MNGNGYWTRQRLTLGAVILIFGAVLIAKNVSNRVQHVAKSPLGTTCVESSDCMSGICWQYNDRHLCTEECGPKEQCRGATHCAEVEVHKGNGVEKKMFCVP